MFDALARIAGLVSSKSPRDSEEIHTIIGDRGMLMMAGNPYESWDIRL
jgi:hypothetical protein